MAFIFSFVYYTHIHNVIETVLDNAENNTQSMAGNALMLLEKFDKGWCNKVMQAQASLYSKTTKGAWIIRFEDIVAEAKEIGPLKNKDFELPAEMVQKLKDALPNKKRLDVLVTLAKFYLANKPEDSGLGDSLGRFGHRQFFGGGKNPAAFTVHFKFLPIVRIFLPSLYS